MAIAEAERKYRISFSDSLAILGVVAAIVLVVLDKMEKLKGPVLFVLLGVAGLMLLPLALGNSWVANASGLQKISRAIAACCFVGFLSALLLQWISGPEAPKHSAEEPHLTNNRNPNTPINPRTVTLHDLFFRDMTPPLAVFDTQKLRSQKLGDITVDTCASLDMERNVVTVAYYVPFWNDTAGVVEQLYQSDLHRKVMKEARGIRAETKFPGDSNTTSSDTVIFSGALYIYHEKEMSIADIANLSRLYSTKKINVQFRSQSYLEISKLRAQGK